MTIEERWVNIIGLREAQGLAIYPINSYGFMERLPSIIFPNFLLTFYADSMCVYVSGCVWKRDYKLQRL